jgi:hypothetical protein
MWNFSMSDSIFGLLSSLMCSIGGYYGAQHVVFLQIFSPSLWLVFSWFFIILFFSSMQLFSKYGLIAES